jgi:guanylate kinase
MATPSDVAVLEASGNLIWENKRYSAAYYIDRPALAYALSVAWPVVHLGQPAAIDAVAGAFPDVNWLIVYLWCARPIAEKRIIVRGTGDTQDRLAAWDATAPIIADIRIDTGIVPPPEAAARIDSALELRLS